jgi:hypothetical protein
MAEAPSNEMIERLAEKLSPEGKEVLARMLRGEGETLGASDEEYDAAVRETAERISKLPVSDQEIFSRLFSLYAQQSAESAEEARREGEEIKRAADIVQRAIELSGVENMRVSEAFEWLRKEGELTEEEWRFYESVKDREVEVPI